MGKKADKTYSFASRQSTINRVEKIFVYETASYFYLVGGDAEETKFKVIKIDIGIYQSPKGHWIVVYFFSFFASFGLISLIFHSYF